MQEGEWSQQLLTNGPGHREVGTVVGEENIFNPQYRDL